MAKQEDIGALVRGISLDDPEDLRKLVVNPYSFEALLKLRDGYTGDWRDKVISFVESINSSYDVEHIKSQIDAALQSRSKMEKFFGNLGNGVLIALGLGVLYWIIFNFGTGLLLFLALGIIFAIGNAQVNEISKQSYSGDTLRLIKDFEKVRQ